MAMTQQAALDLLEKELIRWTQKYPMILGGWSVGLNRRKSSLGLCDYRKRTIYLSKYWIETVSDEEILDTVLHELAHVLAGPRAKHGPEWKKWARELGAQPTAYYKSKRHEVPIPKYFIMHKETNEILGYANRKLKYMSTRYMKGRKAETMGKLKLVETEILEKHVVDEFMNRK